MSNKKLRVCIAGATGWAGSALSKGVHNADDLDLVSAVSRNHAGKNLTDVLGLEEGTIPIFATLQEAMNIKCDVLVEYTKPDVAKHNILIALANGTNVVIGTSGLNNQDYAEIEKVAQANNLSVLGVGNFAITAVLVQKFSEMAAKYIPNWEIIDYAHQGKIDAPSGTARELANRLGKIRESNLIVPIEKIRGEKTTRGARIDGSQVHSIRLPGHVLSVETIFGLSDEKLTLRHDAGASAEPYVQGALLAIRKVGTFKGLKRGLDAIMEF